MLRTFLAMLLLTSSALSASGQEIRFELGQRLRQFERTLDKYPQEEARRRALEPLVQATPTFFQGRLADAAGLLDRARLSLVGEPSPENLWITSLVVRPAKRLLDPGEGKLTCKIEQLYPVKGDQPSPLKVQLHLQSQKQAHSKTSATLEKLPCTVSVDLTGLADGDYQLVFEVQLDGKTSATTEQTISLVKQLNARLDALKQGSAELPAKAAATEKATLNRLIGLLTDLAAGRTQETNYPAARLLKEAEDVLNALQQEKTYYNKDRQGQFWLNLADAKTTIPVRVQIPAQASKGQPLPLVVAMHGAGGSENMFFDGYGDGLVAKLAEKKGWLLVTTRSPLLAFGGGPDVPRVIDLLAERYPVDKDKVFLVGHSMGAAQAVALAGRLPGRFRAVAALGGGGGFKSSDAIKDLPFFVAVGDRDFALNGARSLHAGLVKAGVKKAMFKKYADVEHLAIVQLALPEVYDFFAESLK